jgi:hypothetical protein
MLECPWSGRRGHTKDEHVGREDVEVFHGVEDEVVEFAVCKADDVQQADAADEELAIWIQRMYDHGGWDPSAKSGRYKSVIVEILG